MGRRSVSENIDLGCLTYSARRKASKYCCDLLTGWYSIVLITGSMVYNLWLHEATLAYSARRKASKYCCDLLTGWYSIVLITGSIVYNLWLHEATLA